MLTLSGAGLPSNKPYGFNIPQFGAAKKSSPAQQPSARASKSVDASGIPAIRFPAFGPPAFNPVFHAERRETFLKQLPPNTTVIIAGGGEAPRNHDVNHPFRQESNFYYLTGFEEPNALAILSNQPGKPRFQLIVPPRDPGAETWTGKRSGLEGAVQKYRADRAFSNEQLEAVIRSIAVDHEKVLFLPAQTNLKMNLQVEAFLKEYGAAPYTQRREKPYQAQSILAQMRLVKTPYELALLKRACDISAKGHLRAIKTMGLQPHQMRGHRVAGRNEGEIQAEVEYPFRKHGAVRLGYPTIGGSGANTCVLHYTSNSEYAKPGDLVLVDAGAEYGFYTADITRTWPVSGKFTPPQKAIYDLVLKAQEASIQAVRPGATLKEVHRKSVEVITQGLVDLGLLKGEPEALTREGAYKKYFMHGTSHWLGLDVHDAGDYNTPLAPGMVLTVEPGIYIDPEVAKADGLDPKWWGIGVRIEDDILVTPQGQKNLSEAIPRTTEAIEALMDRRKSLR